MPHSTSPSTSRNLTVSNYLAIMQSEQQELQEIVHTLLRNQCLFLVPVASLDEGEFDLSFQPPPSHLINLHIQSITTDHTWYFQFPSYMQPIFHDGSFAPPESFYKRLLREQFAMQKHRQDQVMGEYARIDQLDQRLDKYARKIVQFLAARSAFRRQVLSAIQRYCEETECWGNMEFEDNRALVRRFEERIKQKCGYSIDELIKMLKQYDKEMQMEAKRQEEAAQACCNGVFSSSSSSKSFSLARIGWFCSICPIAESASAIPSIKFMIN